MAKRRAGRKSKKGLWIALLALVAGAGAYLYVAPEFERQAPQIEAPSHMAWNAKKPIALQVSDNVGLGHYRVVISDGMHQVVVDEGAWSDHPKTATLKIKYPKGSGLDNKAKKLVAEVTVTDSSMWNLMQGNSVTKRIDIDVDTKRPNVNVIANSRSINQGGSALVVFQVEDENLKDVYVEANGYRFEPQPYKKEGYYATLVAWPFTQDSFDAKVVASDEAGNVRNTHIPYYHRNPSYRTSYIRATDKFIDGKISDLASGDSEFEAITDRLKKLKAVNETMRQKNEALIHKLAKKVSDEPIDQWKMKRFYPLKNGKKVASFGDHRYYYYGSKENIISESYHVGYDLASTKMAPVISSNPGTVVYAQENGIYGNMPMIDHGLGLYTLYGHCSQLFVKEGDSVHAGQMIARTGTSGLALGDHLHFGILVQGIEVRPIEWFDQKWITTFIDNVFKEADAIIENRVK